MGTFVVRMIGSSLLVDDEMEGGGRGGGLLQEGVGVEVGCCCNVLRVERLR